jgi:hypothetical protein
MGAFVPLNGNALQAPSLCYAWPMSRTSRAALAAIVIVAAAAALEFAMGRPPICACGRVALWGPVGPTQSQMLADWYSFSHIVHGLLFYALLWLVLRRWPVEQRFLTALLIETAWEIAENTPFVIDRYRAATASLGYTGDSIINSMSDIAMMAIGFLLARKLPVRVSILLLLLLEIIPLVVIRDNLTLNIWMLVAPNKTILAWQSGA